MKLLRTPLVLAGLLLVVIGVGNIYTGRTKTAEYEDRLATKTAPAEAPRRNGTSQLDPELRAALLGSLAGKQDPFSVARAKLDFYRVVHSGGRLLTLLGVFCGIAGIIHFWYRETRAMPVVADNR